MQVLLPQYTIQDVCIVCNCYHRLWTSYFEDVLNTQNTSLFLSFVGVSKES